MNTQTAFALAEAGHDLTEMAEQGQPWVLTYEPGHGYSWYIPNTAPEYCQDDWIFHALGAGKEPSLEAAVAALGKTIERRKRVTPIRPRKAPAKKAPATATRKVAR